MTAEQLLDTVRHELLRRNPVSPALLKFEEDRAENVQSRIADAITAFAGSMAFVYVHVVWFTLWVAIPLEKYPFGLLTMIVSLEAIFLSTFVMISQNRADARRQVFADQQYTMIQEEKQQNEQLLEQSRRIEELNKSILTLTQEVREALKKG
ncbi:MAG: putative rane protein [Actinomycetia bacterium]|nr:putative rane protein [Actinomycetes bacterium]